MLSILATLAVCLPNDQDPVELVRAMQRQVEGHATVAAVEKALAAASPSQLPGFAMPPFAARLRAEGFDALTTVRRELVPAAADQALRIEDVLGVLARVHGDVESGAARPTKLDIDGFVDVASKLHRELVQAIGSGRDTERIVPELRAAIDATRARTENLGAIADADVEILRERLERVGRVDQTQMRALGLSVLDAALVLARSDLAERLAREPRHAARSDGVVQGDVLFDRDAPFGRLVVGGPGRNSYDCTQLDVVIDLGGDDEYRGPAGGAGDRSRLAIVIDLAGNDRYLGGNDALGSGSLGVGLLLDVDGNDQYSAESRSAGFGLAGFGAFVDLAGDDVYSLGDLSAGVGIAATGLFIDLAGSDRMRSGLESCGVGLPGGVGFFCDGAGDDLRRAARRPKSVVDGPAVDVSIAFGVGVGAPPLLAPGVGLFLDLAGNDRYVAAGIAGGVGGRGGVGVFLDALGNDIAEFGDIAFGAGYGHGLGIHVDERGDDTRSAGRFAHGAASDEGIGIAFDGHGDDRVVTNGFALGAARRFAAACFVDLSGHDVYALDDEGEELRIAALRPSSGLALGLFLDLGGADDQYGFHGIVAPDNARTRMLTGGEGDTAHKQVFVDR